jgi:hypothetical protein
MSRASVAWSICEMRPSVRSSTRPISLNVSPDREDRKRVGFDVAESKHGPEEHKRAEPLRDGEGVERDPGRDGRLFECHGAAVIVAGALAYSGAESAQ